MTVKRIGGVIMGMIWSLAAKDLGVHSTTFPIVEHNLLQVIQTQLLSLQSKGELQKKQQEITQRLQKKLMAPPPVLDKKTLSKRVFSFDPTYVVPKDIKDHKGQFIARAGDRLNPLKTRRLNQALLFIDGDDPQQVSWAVAQKKSKIILTKGQPMRLMDDHQRVIYFDQKGVLIQKFGIQAVPARVTQKEECLQIEEIPLKELEE